MQEAIIAENALYDKPLVMYAKEREYLIAVMHKMHPNMRIKSAHLNIEDGMWEIETDD